MDDAEVVPVLDLVVRGVGQHHAAGHREGLDPGSDVHGVAGEPLGLDDHLAHVDVDANRDVVRGELPLDRNGGGNRRERAREHAHAAVPKALDDRAAEIVMVALERTHVPVAFVDCHALVRLHQRRVADHVGEHHRDELAIEARSHSPHLFLLSLLRCGSSAKLSDALRDRIRVRKTGLTRGSPR